MRVLGLGLVVAALGCGEPETLRVGFAVPHHWYRAVRLALEDVPDAPVTVLWDSVPGRLGGAGGAVLWADWHVQHDAHFVIGHDASRPTVGAAGVYNRAGITHLAPVASSSQLEAQGPWSFGMVPNGLVEGRFMAGFADSALHAQRVAILYNNDEFGFDVRAGVVDELARRGIAVVDERTFDPLAEGVPPGVLNPLFTAMLRHQPDAVLIVGRLQEVLLFGAYLRGRGLRVPVVVADGALVLFPGQRTLPRELEEMYMVRLWNPDPPEAQEFIARFIARWGEPPDDAEALTYEATRLALAAARDGARSSADVRRWLMRLGRDRPAFAGLATTVAFRDGRPFTPQLWMHQARAGVLRSLGAIE